MKFIHIITALLVCAAVASAASVGAEAAPHATHGVFEQEAFALRDVPQNGARKLLGHCKKYKLYKSSG